MGRTFERTVLGQLRRGTGSEKYTLPESSEPRLHDALQADLKERDPVDTITRALKLSAALDGKLESPAAAARIRRVLKCNHAVMKLIRSKILKPAAVDQRRAFVRREDRQEAIRAPSFGARAPTNAIPLKDLLNPGNGSNGPRVTRKVAR